MEGFEDLGWATRCQAETNDQNVEEKTAIHVHSYQTFESAPFSD